MPVPLIVSTGSYGSEAGCLHSASSNDKESQVMENKQHFMNIFADVLSFRERRKKNARKKALPKFDYFLSVSMGTRIDEGATASHQLDCWNSSQGYWLEFPPTDEELQVSFGLSTGLLNLKLFHLAVWRNSELHQV